MKELQDETQRLPDLFHFLDQHSPKHDPGLYEGMMGQMIAYCLYDQFQGTNEWEEKASDLLEKICQLLDKELPVTFGKGICGIGWGILYLQSLQFLEEEMEDELQHIDEMVMERCPLKMKDLSLLSGLGGILCYVTSRLGAFEKQKNISFIFEESYLNDLQIASQNALEEFTDYRCRSFAILFLEYRRSHKFWQVLPPRFIDILDLPSFAPKNSCFWETGLPGVTGYIIKLLSVFLNDRDLKYPICY